jgi:hypothetical protein
MDTQLAGHRHLRDLSSTPHGKMQELAPPLCVP